MVLELYTQKLYDFVSISNKNIILHDIELINKNLRFL
jgi:hypothetical protein